ncbi:VOC family protein [Bosea caraganae]|uniref:VOC family protein n=1 Tax=Bosea caraganae TaxID=2763117 RepID=A0A370L551_9HYPH|nr:VOC family protein [Bosea caraganae]RDJ24214.1 VOC family protein [Bosea caraganae]RDJ30255.1 VOC family protein [Bosea caraganae]
MTEPNRPRGLDHLVIGVRDLDAAGRLYEHLGFRVGARNRHPWGTENRIVQFPGAFLELVTVGDPGAIPPHQPHRFSFGAFVRDALARGEGMSMLVLESKDALADAGVFKEREIGDFEPFFFERQAKRPDGSEVRVAFSLAFAENGRAPECGFFTCQQHEPQNFWNLAFQQHPNGTTGLAAAVMVAENPTDHHIFLSAFTGERSLKSNSLGVSAPLPRGRLDILTPHAAFQLFAGEEGAAGPRFAGFVVTVPDLARVRSLLAAGDIPALQVGERIVVPSYAAMGCMVAFEAG